jgi:hypothetical protein
MRSCRWRVLHAVMRSSSLSLLLPLPDGKGSHRSCAAAAARASAGNARCQWLGRHISDTVCSFFLTVVQGPEPVTQHSGYITVRGTPKNGELVDPLAPDHGDHLVRVAYCS